MIILNKEEIDTWLFEHANIQGHECKGMKGTLYDEVANIAFVDTVTGESIDIVYGE